MRPAPSRLSWSALARHRRALSTLRPPALTALIRRQTTADELMSVHKQHQTDFNHIHISQTWKQLAFFAQRSPPAELQRRATLLEPLALTTLDEMRWDHFGPQALTMTANGAAKSGLRARKPPWDGLWKALEDKARRRLDECNPHEITNLMWAFAKAGAAAPQLHAAVADKLEGEGLAGFNPKALSNLAWACAKSVPPEPRLLGVIAAEVQRTGLSEFAPQGLSNLAWAAVTARVADRALLRGLLLAIAKETRTRGVESFKPQELSMLAWACAKHDDAAPPPWLFEIVAAGAVRAGTAAFTPQGLTNLVWACSTANVAVPELYAAVAQEAESRGLRGFSTQGLMNTAWAFASAGEAAPALFAAIGAEVEARPLDTFTVQSLTLGAWSFAAADAPCDALCGEAFVRRLEAERWEGEGRRLMQLHQYALWRDETAAARGSHDGAQLPQALLRRAHEAFEVMQATAAEETNEAANADADLHASPTSAGAVAPNELSRTHEQVIAAARELGLPLEVGLRTAQGYVLDLVLELPRSGDGGDGGGGGGGEGGGGGLERIAVEVEGPHRYVGGGRGGGVRTHQPRGFTLLKRRQLRAAGWKLLLVPYWEWDALKVKPEHKGEEVTSWQLSQREYLSERLEQIVPGWAV